MISKAEVGIRDEDVCIFQRGDRITLESVADVELLITELQDILIIFKKRENAREAERIEKWQAMGLPND